MNRTRVVGVLLAAMIVAAVVFAAIALAPVLTRERIEGWVHGAGAWGPAVLLLLQVGQILIAPIPGVFVPILAGVLYGPIVGPAITVAGTCIGSAAAYWIGRGGGRPLAERLIGADGLERAGRLLGGKRWLALVPLFLIPLSPSDALCFAAGIVRMDWARFCAAVALGRVPKDSFLAAGAALGWSALHF
ncbi:MAG: TVP38/TMEM64 family protein [Candidatus Eiseniibacteriota bacterium]